MKFSNFSKDDSNSKAFNGDLKEVLEGIKADMDKVMGKVNEELKGVKADMKEELKRENE